MRLTATLLTAVSLVGCNRTLSRNDALELVSKGSLDVAQASISSTFDLEDTAYQELLNSGLFQCAQQQRYKCCYYYAPSAECNPGSGDGSAFQKNGGGSLNFTLGYYNAKQALGIVQNGNVASAQIQALFAPSPLYSKYKNLLDAVSTGWSSPPLEILYQVDFLRYDDGWRITGKSVLQRSPSPASVNSAVSLRAYSGDVVLNFDLSPDGGQNWRSFSLQPSHEASFHNMNRFRITTRFTDGHTQLIECELPSGQTAYSIKMNPASGAWDLFTPTGDGLAQVTRSDATRIAAANQQQANDRLVAALINKDAAGLEQALKDGANSNIRFNPGSAAQQNALTFAAQNQSPRFVELLLKSGANVNGDDLDSCPICMAAYLRNVETFRLLFKAGANITAANYHGAGPSAAQTVQGCMSDAHCVEMQNIINAGR
jgi:hypothetical protein